jgi:sugar phosphate isomerase/epimerase
MRDATATTSRPAPSPVGVDTYSYHRLLGETRPGERPPTRRFRRGSLDAVAEARTLALDFALLETCFLGDAGEFAPDEYIAEAGGLQLGLSWGAPDGLAFGQHAGALDELLTWLPHAASLELPLMRIVAGSPAQLGQRWAALVPMLRAACEAARDFGLVLALENHGDLTADGVERILEQVGDERLRVCFDTANALRVGDDVVTAARRLSAAIDVIHVKDCAGLWGDQATGPVSVPPGEGVIPIDDVLEACPRALACVELGQLPPEADELSLVAAYVAYLRSP